MDAITYLNIIFRLTIWFLLTADFSLANIIIGIIIVFLLPRNSSHLGSIKDWVQVIWKILQAIPQAYIEAIEIMIYPHNYEEIYREKVNPRRTSGLIFLDIFLITFTPKSIVVKYNKKGWYEVHKIQRRKKS